MRLTYMQRHPQYQEIAEHIERFPKFGHQLFQTYLDLLVGRRWPKLQVLDSEELERTFVLGQKEINGEIHILLPMSIDETVSASDLDAIFRNMPQKEFSPDFKCFTPPIMANSKASLAIEEAATAGNPPVDASVSISGAAEEPDFAIQQPVAAAEETTGKQPAGPKKQPEGLVMAICDHSSSVVYYRIHDGIVPPKG